MSEEAPTPVGVIETDAFCDSCGFNLHTQKVWRDPRLGVLICRCPECGAHQSAGVKTTATSAWLRRLTLIALLFWFGLALLFSVGSFFTLFGNDMAFVTTLTTSRYETREGEPVYIQNNATGPNGQLVPTWVAYQAMSVGGAQPTPTPQSDVIHRTKLVHIYMPREIEPSNTQWWERGAPLVGVLMLVGTFCVLTFAIGCTCAAGSWFWRPGRRWLWLVLPPLAAAVAWAVLITDARSERYAGMPVEGAAIMPTMLLSTMLLQLAVLAIGLVAGRPFARLLLSIFIPPKPRQLFAFLWHCDGKTMPAAKPPRI